MSDSISFSRSVRRKLARVQTRHGPTRSLTSRVLGFLGRKSGGQDGTRIAMLHAGRTGSTVLAGMIQSSPEIYWDDEALHPREQRINFDPAITEREQVDSTVLEQEIRRRFINAGGRRYGSEFKPRHFKIYGVDDPGEARDILEAAGFGSFVSLVRKNVLRQLLSSIRGARAGDYHVRIDSNKSLGMTPVDDDPAAIRIHATDEPLPLEEHLERRDREMKWLKEVVGPGALHLEYESHVRDDPGIGYELICKHVGLEVQDVAPGLERTNPGSVDKLLANPGAWRKRIDGTRFSWMFDAD